jgi:hypothetical protein
MNDMHCSDCGRFCSYLTAYIYTPYGNCTMMEPPDEEFICGQCYNSLDERGMELLYNTSWLKPQRMRSDTSCEGM